MSLATRINAYISVSSILHAVRAAADEAMLSTAAFTLYCFMQIDTSNLLHLSLDYQNRKLYFVEASDETHGVINELSITDNYLKREVVQDSTANPSAAAVNPVNRCVICDCEKVPSKAAASDDRGTRHWLNDSRFNAVRVRCT